MINEEPTTGGENTEGGESTTENPASAGEQTEQEEREPAATNSEPATDAAGTAD